MNWEYKAAWAARVLAPQTNLRFLSIKYQMYILFTTILSKTSRRINVVFMCRSKLSLTHDELFNSERHSYAEIESKNLEVLKF